MHPTPHTRYAATASHAGPAFVPRRGHLRDKSYSVPHQDFSDRSAEASLADRDQQMTCGIVRELLAVHCLNLFVSFRQPAHFVTFFFFTSG